MSELSVSCEYCVGQDPLLTATVPESISVMQWRKAWKRAAAMHRLITCPTCGAGFSLEDDNIAPEQGGLVARTNVSKPRIDSLNVSTGARTGGNAVFITGQALDIGDLVVKFGGKAATAVDQRTSTTARVIVPPATYELNVATRAERFETTPVLGSLQENEPVTSPAGSTGTVWLIEGNVHWIHLASVAVEDAALVGVGFTGGTSGGVVTVTAWESKWFTPGEMAIGLSSAAQGTVRGDHPLVIDGPSGGFAPDELVRGTGSDVLAKLTGSPAYSGLVNVTAENEHGQRDSGGTLYGAYTYA